MKIESKFEIGQAVWVVYPSNGEVNIYDDEISEICVDEDGIYYILREACIDGREEEIIAYEDKEGLINKIEKLMKEIREKEKKNVIK